MILKTMTFAVAASAALVAASDAWAGQAWLCTGAAR